MKRFAIIVAFLLVVPLSASKQFGSFQKPSYFAQLKNAVARSSYALLSTAAEVVGVSLVLNLALLRGKTLFLACQFLAPVMFSAAIVNGIAHAIVRGQNAFSTAGAVAAEILPEEVNETNG